MPNPTALTTYLAEVEERYDLTQAVPYPTASTCHNCIADVPTLVKMLREFHHACVVLPGHTFAGIADGVRTGVEKVDRLAREAMEKRGG